MIKFIKSIDEIFDVKTGDYFCLVDDSKKVNMEFAKIVYDIAIDNDLDYYLTIPKCEHATRHLNLLPLSLGDYNYIQGLIIKQKGYKSISDLDQIQLEVQANFAPLNIFNESINGQMLNKSRNIHIDSIKQLKIAISTVVIDQIDVSVTTSSRFARFDDIVDRLKSGEDVVVNMLTAGVFDNPLLFAILASLDYNVKDYIEKNEQQIINSENKKYLYN